MGVEIQRATIHPVLMLTEWVLMPTKISCWLIKKIKVKQDFYASYGWNTRFLANTFKYIKPGILHSTNSTRGMARREEKSLWDLQLQCPGADRVPELWCTLWATSQSQRKPWECCTQPHKFPSMDTSRHWVIVNAQVLKAPADVSNVRIAWKQQR